MERKDTNSFESTSSKTAASALINASLSLRSCSSKASFEGGGNAEVGAVGGAAELFGAVAKPLLAAGEPQETAKTRARNRAVYFITNIINTIRPRGFHHKPSERSLVVLIVISLNTYTICCQH